ncbi:MAG: DUF4112 domain-containing protein [Candidatus Melainabacteria bacterium]
MAPLPKETHPDHHPHPGIRRAKTLARLMDRAIEIPFTKQRIGLDPLLGVLPVGGEVVAALLSLYPVWVAYELGFPGHVHARLAANILIDILIGSIPLLGDVSDAFWRANTRNVRILEEAYTLYGEPPVMQPGSTVVDVQAEAVDT